MQRVQSTLRTIKVAYCFLNSSKSKKVFAFPSKNYFFYSKSHFIGFLISWLIWKNLFSVLHVVKKDTFQECSWRGLGASFAFYSTQSLLVMCLSCLKRLANTEPRVRISPERFFSHISPLNLSISNIMYVCTVSFCLTLFVEILKYIFFLWKSNCNSEISGIFSKFMNFLML